MAGDHSAKRSHQAPTSQEFSERFFLWGNNSSTLQVNTLKYYEYGWRLISFSMLASTPIDQIDSEIVDAARVLQFPIIIFREEVSFSDLTRAAHEEILRPKSSHHYESTMETLLNSILETGRDKAFLDRELGPLLALPLRPRTTLTATLETCSTFTSTSP